MHQRKPIHNYAQPSSSLLHQTMSTHTRFSLNNNRQSSTQGLDNQYLDMYQQQKGSIYSPDLLLKNQRKSQEQASVTLKLHQILQHHAIQKSSSQHTNSSSLDMLHDTNQNDEISMLRAENKKLIRSIAQLNINYQTQKQQTLILQKENKSLKTELYEQGQEFSRMIDALNEEKADLLRTVEKLRKYVQDRQKQTDQTFRPTRSILTQGSDIDINELKQRILSRKREASKSTYEQDKENIPQFQNI